MATYIFVPRIGKGGMINSMDDHGPSHPAPSFNFQKGLPSRTALDFLEASSQGCVRDGCIVCLSDQQGIAHAHHPSLSVVSSTVNSALWGSCTRSFNPHAETVLATVAHRSAVHVWSINLATHSAYHFTSRRIICMILPCASRFLHRTELVPPGKLHENTPASCNVGRCASLFQFK